MSLILASANGNNYPHLGPVYAAQQLSLAGINAGTIGHRNFPVIRQSIG